MNGRVWLIGGTTESAQLGAAIAQFQLPCTISVTTEAARLLYPASPFLQVMVQRLDSAGIEAFLQAQNIVAVLDASHPYAVEISRLAIAACTQLQIPYLRYERPCLEEVGRGAEGDVPISSSHFPVPNFPVLELNSWDTLVAGDYLQGERVLLTVGYKVLPLFRSWQDKAILFARILPAVASLEAALAAGFTPDRLIAVRPPVSAELERALWRQWEISVVVTKASGAAGGEDIKRAVAAELGVKLIAIARPVVDYIHKTSDLSTAIAFCQQHCFETV